tara:strand:+ start:184 stop:912 length:729 start_codon:yes stop_codon:yes gene_type:complete
MPIMEKRNVDKWIKIEATMNVITSVFIFITFFILDQINIEFETLIYFRLIFYQLAILIYFLSLSEDLKVREMKISSSRIETYNVSIILLIFCLKVGLLELFTSSYETETVKYLIVLYNFLSVIFAIALRKLIAATSNDFNKLASMCIKFNTIIMCITFLTLYSGWSFAPLIQMNCLFLSIAISYNFFQHDNFAFKFIFSIIMSLMVILLFINALSLDSILVSLLCILVFFNFMSLKYSYVSD